MSQTVQLPKHIQIMAEEIVRMEGLHRPQDMTEKRDALAVAQENAKVPQDAVDGYMQMLREKNLRERIYTR